MPALTGSHTWTGAFTAPLSRGRVVPDLLQAVVDLQLGVLAERRRLATDDDHRLAGLRDQITQHIEEHLGEPDLSPATIAEELGISLRYAHQVFNHDGDTIAAFVRNRRLDAVAETLRRPVPQPPLGELATRYGFGSRDQLTRAFRRRFGTTTGEYRQQAS